MTLKIKIPDIGTDEVEVTEILVRVGDIVNVDQSLIVVEGDKASIEIPSPSKGTIKEININVGDKVSTGSQIMLFEVNSSNISTNTEHIDNVSAVDTTINSSIKTIESFYSASQNKKISVHNDKTYVHATPSIRKEARKLNVDLTNVKGTGRKGRILREDIQKYIQDTTVKAKIFASDVHSSSMLMNTSSSKAKTDLNRFGITKEIELSKIQKVIGTNLHRNWTTIPHVTQFDEADITELEVFRRQQNAEAEQKKLKVKITTLIFVMKAVAKALEKFPHFNSSLSEDLQKLIIRQYINIGVAVDTPNGLIVPVLCDVNKKGISELSYELSTISSKARNGSITSSEMKGGCFTISNLGGLGGSTFTPIVNAPEVAILGVSKSLIKPVWNGKEFLPRLILPLSLSYDHRVINGADGVRFISFISEIISDIRRLII